jgi:hypothetical protein
MPDIVNRASILAFSAWIPADNRREDGREGGETKESSTPGIHPALSGTANIVLHRSLQIRSIMQLQSQAKPVRSPDFLIVQFIIFIDGE